MRYFCGDRLERRYLAALDARGVWTFISGRSCWPGERPALHFRTLASIYFASKIFMGRVLEVLQSLGANSNSDVYVITAISIHLSPGKLQTICAYDIAGGIPGEFWSCVRGLRR
jgi:hypothetical protein